MVGSIGSSLRSRENFTRDGTMARLANRDDSLQFCVQTPLIVMASAEGSWRSAVRCGRKSLFLNQGCSYRRSQGVTRVEWGGRPPRLLETEERSPTVGHWRRLG
jgi:hypothetical protein